MSFCICEKLSGIMVNWSAKTTQENKKKWINSNWFLIWTGEFGNSEFFFSHKHTKNLDRFIFLYYSMLRSLFRQFESVQWLWYLQNNLKYSWSKKLKHIFNEITTLKAKCQSEVSHQTLYARTYVGAGKKPKCGQAVLV